MTDGPFAATSELVAGFWLWQVEDMDEAVAWARRCPNPMPGPSEIEVRPLFELADFGEAVTAEVAEEEERTRECCEALTVIGRGGHDEYDTRRDCRKRTLALDLPLVKINQPVPTTIQAIVARLVFWTWY